jgi:cytochrome P450
MERPNLLDPAVRNDPYPLYADLRRHHPVCQVDPGGLYAVARYEDVLYVLKNPQRFSSGAARALLKPPWLERSPLASSLVSQDPPVHARLRALVQPAFGPRALTRLEGQVRATAEQLGDRLAALGEADFIEHFALRLPATVICHILGLDPERVPQLRRWAAAIAAITSAPTDPQRIAEIRAPLAEMEAHLHEVIVARRQHPEDDMISDLLASRPEAGGAGMNEEEILSFLFLAVPAGFQTTTGFLVNAVRTLMARPQDHERLHADPVRIPAFLEEVLRYDAPVQSTARLVLEETELRGVSVPRGALLFLLLASANRDENQFPDPDRFDMDRGPTRHLAFGHGIHYCMGEALARLEGRVGLAVLLARFGRFEPLFDSLSWSQSLTSRIPLAMPLRYVQR